METNTLNPVHVNCPECQKLFRVDTGTLSSGQARFQCTSCDGLFAFNWPQPPEVTVVRAQILEDGELPREDKTKPVGSQTCFRCSEKCSESFTECPHCGVIFNKIKKIRPPEPVIHADSLEITQGWEAVRTSYANEKKHEEFILACLVRDNLAFASSQYRAILLVNPSEPMALKMQNRIVELATTRYVPTQGLGPRERRRFSAVQVITGLGGLFIILGITFPAARSLIAIGSSFIAFALLFQFWIVRAD